MTKLPIVMVMVLIPLVHAKTSLNKLKIKNLELIRCGNTFGDPITLENVTIDIIDTSTFHVSGAFSSTIDLEAPITASIELKRKIIFWVEVPCRKNLGSCTYDDLCSFGIPKNKVCPNIFKKNKVPCRCPIKKGTYILPETLAFFPSTLSSIYTGTYKGTITVSSDQGRLACYNVNFVLYDGHS